jgi:hypothetical protein
MDKKITTVAISPLLLLTPLSAAPIHVLLIIIYYFLCLCIPRGLWPPVAWQPRAGYGLFVSRGFLNTYNDAPESEGLLLWTSDQLVAETST